MPNLATATGGGCSETGPVRHGNEDRFSINDAFGLFVVADCTGGHSAGEVASELAIDTIISFIARSQDSHEFSSPCGILPPFSSDGKRLRTALHLANRRVFRSAEAHDDYLGTGTTADAALTTAGRMAVAHVGDSRAYRLRGGHLQRLTRDDSWMAAMLSGDVAAALAAGSRDNVTAEVITRREAGSAL